MKGKSESQVPPTRWIAYILFYPWVFPKQDAMLHMQVCII